MEILNDNDLIAPQKIDLAFENTSYPLRIGLGKGEGQVLKQISLEHFNCFLAMKNEQIKLAQLILLNKIYNLNTLRFSNSSWKNGILKYQNRRSRYVYSRYLCTS